LVNYRPPGATGWLHRPGGPSKLDSGGFRVAYYFLSTYDERDNNYVTLRDNLDGRPLVYCAYLDCMCQACHSIDRDAMFALKCGLEGGPKIRVSKRRELAEARDGFLLVKNRVLDLLKRHEVAGYDTRPIPCTDWHVFRSRREFPTANSSPSG
jgi:hypothetical protein